MRGLRAEFEQKFTEVLTSRAATAPRGAMGTLDPHSGRRPDRDGRSPPRRHQRDLSSDTERLPRRPGELRQQLELHHTAQPSRGTSSISRRTEDGPSQPPADTIRGGEDNATAIVRGRYRGVCHGCTRSSPGVDQGLLEQLSAENTARLAPSLARPGRSRSGAIARSTRRSIPVPASHIALEGWSARRCRKAPPTAGPAITGELSDAWPRPAARGVVPVRGPHTTVVSPNNRVTKARGTLWSIICHQDYLSGEDRIPCPPKTSALAPSP